MLKLKSLYEHCIFRSEERSETHALVSNELSDHHLRWQGGAVNTQMYKFNAKRLALYSLRYGDEVKIYPKVYPNFSLVHFSHSGGIEIEADGRKQAVHQSRAIVSSPQRNINLHWTNACEQLILRVPHALLLDAAKMLGQANLYSALRRNPGLLLSEAASQQWRMQLNTFVALESYSQQSEAYLPWLDHLEKGMAMFLLMQSPDAVDASSSHRKNATTHLNRAAKRVDRLHEFAFNNLTRPVTLSDLAQAAALSERQLNAFCHEQFGQTPMAWFRNLRLEAVHEILRTAPDADLSGTALLHGFEHLGRFSAYYRDRFGELPSQTLKSAKYG